MAGEGAGSLFQREVFAYLVARHLRYEFVRFNNSLYTGHEIQSNLSADTERGWAALFSFLGEPGVSSDRVQLLTELSEISVPLADDFLWSIPFEVSYPFIARLDPSLRAKLIEQLRKEFWGNLPSAYVRHAEHLRTERYVALHIRNRSRGDVVHGLETFPWQCFSVDYGLLNNNPRFYANFYAKLIMKICEKHNIKQVRVFSTGDHADFWRLMKFLEPYNARLFLNRSSHLDFFELANADALVMAHSSFSWLAALINVNHVYVRSGFRHFVPANATVIEDDEIVGPASFSERAILFFQTIIFRLRLKLKKALRS